MPAFAAVVLTAPPPGMAAEAGGAFVKIDGREALLRSVELFLNREQVKHVLLVVDGDAVEQVKQKYGAHLGFTGVKVVTGGPRWIDQLAAAAPALSSDATHVILHDAARPIVPFSDIDRLLEEAERHPAVALASPLRATLVEIDEGDNPVAFHLPSQYHQLLTPQSFQRQVFNEMSRTKIETHPSRVTLIKGSLLNIRIGGVGDGSLARAMLNLLPKPKIKPTGSPFDEAQW